MMRQPESFFLGEWKALLFSALQRGNFTEMGHSGPGVIKREREI